MINAASPRLSIYIFCWNEARMLPWTLRFYRHHFPGSFITVYDNESDDGTAEIAKSNGCQLVSFSTSGHYDELTLTKLRNTCWHGSATPWVLVVDCDELASFTLEDLRAFEHSGFNVVRFEGYNMVTMRDDLSETSIDQVTHGARSSWYDKSLLFDRTAITSINFTPGSHQCSPRARFLKKARVCSLGHKLYHFKYTSYSLLVERYLAVKTRSSRSNAENGLGYHYQLNAADLLLEFRQVQSSAVDLGGVFFGPDH